MYLPARYGILSGMRILGILALVLTLASCGDSSGSSGTGDSGADHSIRACYEFRKVAREYNDDNLRGQELEDRARDVWEKARDDGAQVEREAEAFWHAADSPAVLDAAEVMDGACTKLCY